MVSTQVYTGPTWFYWMDPSRVSVWFYSRPETVLEPPRTPRARRSCRLGDGDSGCYAASSGCRPPFGGCRGDPATAAGREEHHGNWSPDGPRLTSERGEEGKKEGTRRKERGEEGIESKRGTEGSRKERKERRKVRER